MRSYLILFVLLAAITTSCEKKDSSDIIFGKVEFSYDSIVSKLNDEMFKYDSLFIERARQDSLVIIRYLGGDGYYNYIPFSLIDNVFYEKRITPQEIEEGETETSIISIPTFMQKDTSFTYFPEDDFFPVFVVDLSFDKSKYIIERDNDGFTTTKQSLVDTTYKEIYYYDRNYNIYKFVNTWKDNKCVYIRKK